MLFRSGVISSLQRSAATGASSLVVRFGQTVRSSAGTVPAPLPDSQPSPVHGPVHAHGSFFTRTKDCRHLSVRGYNVSSETRYGLDTGRMHVLGRQHVGSDGESKGVPMKQLIRRQTTQSFGLGRIIGRWQRGDDEQSPEIGRAHV